MRRFKGVRVAVLATLLFTSQSVLASELLLQAARDGNTSKLQSLLDNGTDINYARADGSTALAWAIYDNNTDVAELLIRSGADVNAVNDYGVTPLSLACTNGNTGIVQNLLDAGANPDIAQETGKTPLMTCANIGAVEAVKALVEHGADVNAKEFKFEQTALMWAAAERHPEVVELLLLHGADVKARSKITAEPEPFILQTAPGTTVLGSNFPDTIYFPETSGGFTALHFAAQQGDVESARHLLKAGADIDTSHKEHGSPLIIAIASGHQDLAMFLLKEGANPNVKDGWGITPLHYALHEGVLILHGFKPSDTDRFGWTRKNMPELVNALLDFGANPNARIERSYNYLDNPFLSRGGEDISMIDPVGATPLLLAAASGDTESMMILEEVSDVKASTIGGATLLMLAAGSGAERGSRSEKQALEATRLALSIGGGNVNDYLTAKAPDGPAKDKADGRTALHFAAGLGWPQMIRLLVENGADLNAKDRYGMTPLQIALGDPEGRYFRQIGGIAYNSDERYRGSGMNKKLADLLLELGAEPFTGVFRDRSGE
jgi:ankyrin repeat protein